MRKHQPGRAPSDERERLRIKRAKKNPGSALATSMPALSAREAGPRVRWDVSATLEGRHPERGTRRAPLAPTHRPRRSFVSIAGSATPTIKAGDDNRQIVANGTHRGHLSRIGRGRRRLTDAVHDGIRSFAAFAVSRSPEKDPETTRCHH